MKLEDINTPFFVLNEISEIPADVLMKMKKEFESYSPPIQVVNTNSYLVDIENIDPDVPKARFSTPGSTCLDLFTREEVKVCGLGFTPDGINPVHKIPLNVKVRPLNPKMYTKLAPRSSTCLNYGLIVANSIGQIDQDYNSEVALLVINIISKEVTIPKGTKIAQLEFCIKPHIIINETTIRTTDDHKGFGSTGTK